MRSEIQHRSRSAAGTLAGFLSASTRAAGTVALERNRGQRLRRLSDVAADATRERVRPRRPRMASVVALPGGRVGWRETAVPRAPGPLGATVAPLAMATCDLDRPLGLGATAFPLPLHLGHECVAEVLAVGSLVETVRAGDRVVVPFQISCGRCAACRQGLTGNCREVPPISMYGFGAAGGAWGGAFAEQVAVPYADAMLVPLPAGLDPASVASAGDTLSDAYRHVAPHLDLVRRHPDGPRILLVGAVRRRSPIGASVPLYAGQIARALLPEVAVTVVDARPEVRDEAARLGLDSVPPGTRQLAAALVVDCSGHPAGLQLALAATAPDGICSCAGTLHASVPVPAARMFGRNVTLTIARSHLRTVLPAVLDLAASGRIQPEQVTTTVAPFDDAPAALQDHLTGNATKTVLVRS